MQTLETVRNPAVSLQEGVETSPHSVREVRYLSQVKPRAKGPGCGVWVMCLVWSFRVMGFDMFQGNGD